LPKDGKTMTPLKIATLALAVFAAPAAAGSLSDTHEMRWTPAGKVPIATYHPLKRCATATHAVHLSGKMPYHAPKATPSKCRKELAGAHRASGMPTTAPD